MSKRLYLASVGAVAAAIASIVSIVLVLGQGPDATRQQPAATDSIEDAQRLVDFTLASPGDVPAQLVFDRAFVSTLAEGVQVVELRYTFSEAAGLATDGFSTHERMGVVVSQSEGNEIVSANDPSETVGIQGTVGSVLRGEDIGNPGLLVVEWLKGGVTFHADAFPNDAFTEQDFLRFLNSFD